MVSWFKKGLVIAKNQLYKTGKDSRLWISLILAVCILIQYLAPLNLYGVKFHAGTTPFLLPVLYADGYISNGLLKVLLYLVIIAVFCDAPFLSGQTAYEAVRSGVSAWHLGKILYLWLMSFLYPLFLSLVSFLIVLPTVTVHDLWGSTLRGLAAFDGSVLYYTSSLMPPVKVILSIYPWSAHLLTFTASALSNVLLGHLIYFGNLFTGKSSIGTAAAVLMVMLDPIVEYWGSSGAFFHWLYRISPVTWSSIEHWKIVGSAEPLSPAFVFRGYLLLTALLEGAIFLTGPKRRSILSAGTQ